MKFFLSFLLLILVYSSYAQRGITGFVRDEEGKGINHVSIVVFAGKSDNIITYTRSDQNGRFGFFTDSFSDSLRIKFSHLQYASVDLHLSKPYSYPLNILLRLKAIQLSEIKIEDKKDIKLRKDTLSYDVKSFADNSDRVIIDVIRKLPGIKVGEGGQIFYQNKPINKFYIDGKDLLENRYVLASNNINLSAVEVVQVLEKHQPIKILDSIESSNRAAINIKLYKNATRHLIGNGSAEFGFPILSQNHSISSMRFGETNQFIGTLKKNNIGIYLDDEVKEQGNSSNLESTELDKSAIELISSSPPPFDRFRYWFNNNTLASVNILTTLSKNLDAKFYMGFTDDHLKESINSLTKIYLPADTFLIHEAQNNVKDYSKLLSGITLQTNTKKIYLKNSIRSINYWDVSNGHIESNAIHQRLNSPFKNFINEFTGIFKIYGSLINISSFSSFSDLPESLNITPGLYDHLFNNNVGFEKIIQSYEAKTFKTENSLSYIKRLGYFSISNKIGGSLLLRTIRNDLSLVKDFEVIWPGTEFVNSVRRNKAMAYNIATLNYLKRKLSFSIAMNFGFNNIRNKGKAFDLPTSNFYLDPSLSISYKVNPDVTTTISLSNKSYLSYDYNPSHVLKNYRVLFTSTGPPKRTETNNFMYRLEYKNIISGIFANLTAQYNLIKTNIVIETSYDGVLTFINSTLRESPANNLNIQFNFNKYFADINTIFDLSTEYDVNMLLQLQQGVLTNFRNRTALVTAKLISKIDTKLSLEYSSHFTKQFSSVQRGSLKDKFTPITLSKQMCLIKFFFPRNISVKPSAEYYANKTSQSGYTHNFFIDCSIQKSIKYPKIDLSLSATNILNLKKHRYYDYSDNHFVESGYTLRPRMLLAKVGFQY